MKELTIEEKAKRYDEAIKVAKDSFNYPDYPGFIRADVVFPELAESEDERIRGKVIATIHLYYGEPLEDEAKEMIAWLKKQGESDETKAKTILINKGYPIDANGTFPTYEEMYDIIKEGLEKQCEQKPIIEMKSAEESLGIDSETYNIIVDECIYGEQKPTKGAKGNDREIPFSEQEWSEEDERCWSIIIAEFSKCAGKSVSKDEWMRCNDWLNSLRDRVQPKQEWSEEDEQYVKDTLALLSFGCSIHGITQVQDWLKSLKERYTWKPSDEQIASITCAVRKMKESACYDSELVSLFNDLEKLKG